MGDACRCCSHGCSTIRSLGILAGSELALSDPCRVV
jgi:hypothetical protein